MATPAKETAMDHAKPNPELYGLPGTVDHYQGMPYLWVGRSGL